MLTLSLVAGLTSGICWLLGDIFLVGFDIEEDKHKNFLHNTKIKNKKLAVLMLSGSVKRLRFGALIAHFSVPCMLFSLYSLFSMAQPSVLANIAAALLGIGFCISPLAHVAYYYVGTLCKNLYEEQQSTGKVSERGQALVNEYVRVLDITWFAAIGITAVGWVLYTLLIFMNKTALPPLFGLLTPLIISPLALLMSKLKIGRPYLNGAGFNIGSTVFFLSVLIFQLVQ